MVIDIENVFAIGAGFEYHMYPHVVLKVKYVSFDVTTVTIITTHQKVLSRIQHLFLGPIDTNVKC